MTTTSQSIRARLRAGYAAYERAWEVFQAHEQPWSADGRPARHEGRAAADRVDVRRRVPGSATAPWW